MKAVESKNFYELLGLEPKASKEEIRTAYREIARIYHPDSNFYDEILGDVQINALDEDVFKRITEAYNTLVNEQQRAVYDQTIPKGLRSWEEKEPSFQQEQSVHKQMQRDAAGDGRVVGRPHTFGTFGVMRDGQGPTSAFDHGSEPPPVSEVIHLKGKGGGVMGTLRRLFGGR
jgi:DnaJ-class molecular chaperone